MHSKLILSSAVAAVIGLVTACGGGGGGDATTVTGIGGTGITASGPITGFGSVFVNGIKFETDSSSFSINDLDTGVSESDLRIGMVVTVRGSVNDDGMTGTADSIDFDNELEGPIGTGSIDSPNVTTKTFTVMGIPVEISSTDTVFGDNITFNTLDDTMLVEVSGLVNSDGTLHATYIEAEDDPYDISDDVEARGVIANLDLVSGTFDLMLATGTIEVKYDGTTDVSDLPGGVPENGQRVEVEGFLENGNTDPFVILAEEIESESFDDGEDNDVSLKGFISNFISTSNFVVSGQAVNADTVVTNFTLGNGILVEVEGPIVNGVLIADEVELED